MSAPPDAQKKTRSSLLARLKDWRDNDSWQTFFDTYWSLIYGTAIKSGLTPPEAEDVVQETVFTVVKRINEFHYDRAKGTFRGWLGKIIRSRIADQFRKRLPVKPPSVRPSSDTSRTSTTRRIPDPVPVNFYTVYDLAWREHLREKALELLKEEGSSIAFPATIEQVHDDMEQVANRLADAKADEITVGIEEDIVAALEEL
ncbi:MAG: sigma-70 family RNA polymerase sigma factor, partial [Verrucomicrobiae bacterium]|nr:sigma-70 family RNA polymerase sigma factor [Verrucomicrobiae bacterium]